jgi:hypothetical protein
MTLTKDDIRISWTPATCAALSEAHMIWGNFGIGSRFTSAQRVKEAGNGLPGL